MKSFQQKVFETIGGLAYSLIILCAFGTALVAVNRVVTNSDNHSGIPFFELCLLAFVVSSVVMGLRFRKHRKLGKALAAGWLCAVLCVVGTGVLDHCNFLVQYDKWTGRGMPDPNQRCCAVIPFAKACR